MKKNKICVNCEARVGLEETICPYCGFDGIGIKEKQDFESDLYPPIYNLEEKKMMSTEKKTDIEKKVETNEEKQEKISLFPFITFSLGISVLIFGIFLFLFSTKGEIFFRWNAKFWFFYVLISLPLIFLANKMSSKK